jgi:flagellar protein FliS
MNTDALNSYKQTKVRTAGQARLIIMLYDEAVKQLDLALQELDRPNRKIDYVHNSIVKTQDIVTELMVSLDFERGGEIARNLFSLYMFFNQQLVNANMKKDPELIRQVRTMIGDLRSAWVAIEGKVQTNENASGPGINIAG